MLESASFDNIEIYRKVGNKKIEAENKYNPLPEIRGCAGFGKKLSLLSIMIFKTVSHGRL